MPIDVSQFHQVFFEESFEGLDIMESGLLNLDLGAADAEAINTIFRAAHSIKGGGGTFGFVEISDFTHVMETLLDEMRDGRRKVTREGVNLLLESVDCLREMLTATQAGEELDHARISGTKRQLDDLLGDGHAVVPPDECDTAQAPHAAGWRVRFRPHAHMLRTGNEPLRMFRELASLGSFRCKVDTSGMPSFADLDPESCFLAWELVLAGEMGQHEVAEVFEWVDGDCDLEIMPLKDLDGSPVKDERISTAQEPPDRQQNATAGLAPVPDAPERRVGDRRNGEDRRRTDRRRSAGAQDGGGSIRVSTEKIDGLINTVGELVITQSMLSQLGELFDTENGEKLRMGLEQLGRNTRELQESIMQVRMLPISFSFNRFPRLVHDLSQKLNKKVELKLSGEQTELDKTVLEKIGDPLVHLVRNSLDHGIELPDVRKAAGKNEIGILHLNAYHQGGNIVIEITDDGAGLNEQRILAKARERGVVGPDEELTQDRVYDLIFQPGFSTVEQVSDLSGRGVGMDVVRRNIKDLGGTVEVRTRAGEGSTFTIRLPLTLAILDGQLVRVGGQTYIVPLISIIESLQVRPNEIKAIAGRAELYRLREEYIPITRLYEVFGIEPDSTELHKGLIVIVEGGGEKAGLFVDELLGQQQVVIKSLETNYQRVCGISGATILGDGTVALILDIAGLMDVSRHCHTTGAPAADTLTRAVA